MTMELLVGGIIFLGLFFSLIVKAMEQVMEPENE